MAYEQVVITPGKDEVWYDYPIAPDVYMVSSYGRVRSKPHVRWSNKNHMLTRYSYPARAFRDPESWFSKQIMTVLYINGQVIVKTLKRIVAETFVPNTNPEQLTRVSGIDNDIFNVSPSNLQWVAGYPQGTAMAMKIARLQRNKKKALSKIVRGKYNKARDTHMMPLSFRNNCLNCANVQINTQSPKDSICGVTGVSCLETKVFCVKWKFKEVRHEVALLNVQDEDPITEYNKVIHELEHIDLEQDSEEDLPQLPEDVEWWRRACADIRSQRDSPQLAFDISNPCIFTRCNEAAPSLRHF